MSAIGKLRITVVVDLDVDRLDAWDAGTLEQAAVNQLRWYQDGTSDLIGDIAAGTPVSLGVKAVALISPEASAEADKRLVQANRDSIEDSWYEP